MNTSSSNWRLRLASKRATIAFSTAWLLILSAHSSSQDANGSDPVVSSDDVKPSPKPRPTRAEMEQDAENLRAAEPDIRARSTRIKEELAALPESDIPADHWARNWAGEYYVGDGLGMNVRILVAPTGGITYTWHGCMGLYDGNHGDIADTLDLDGDGRPDGLKIKWALHAKSGYDFDSENFYFVRWAGQNGRKGRRYFVPEAQMLKMVNDFNEGGFARDGMYSAPLKNDPDSDKQRRRSRIGRKKPVEGVPELPAKWAKLLLLKPVDAKVTSVSPVTIDEVDVTRARVTLDKGSADGLYLGLVVFLEMRSYSDGILTIDKVQEHTAEAAFWAFTSAAPPRLGEIIRVIQGADQPDAQE